MITNDWLENLGQETINNLNNYNKIKYPIYVPSKSRSEIKLTTKCLENIPFYVVIEPQDADNYRKEYSEDKLLPVIRTYFKEQVEREKSRKLSN